MPINKNAMLRYFKLDACFRDTKNHYSVYDLVFECSEALDLPTGEEITREQILKDIRFMESAKSWNVKLDRYKIEGKKRTFFRYKDPNFSICNFPFTEEQCQQIQATVDALNAFEGLPEFTGINDCLSKLKLYAIKTETRPCFSLEHNELLKGIEYLTPLFNAIQNNSVLKIRYHDFGEKPQTLTFHPQFLKQYNNRWFVMGCKEERPGKIRPLSLDRIEGIEPAPEYNYRNTNTDWDEYFDDMVGVSTSTKTPVETVHFLVYGKTAHYIENNPLHGSQVNHWIDENTLDIKLKVKINKELERILLSYAPDIRLLAPAQLVKTHREQLAEAIKRYEKSQQ